MLFKKKKQIDGSSFNMALGIEKKLGIVLFSIYFLFQVGLPLRHHFYKGDVHWTEEGHRMAWQMMLRAKSGGIDFVVIDHDNRDTTRVNPGRYMSSKLRRVIATRPDMAWQFIQRLKKDLNNQGISNYSIYANSWARLNNRKSAPLISPEYDLAKVEWQPFRHSDWLMPMPEQ